MLSRLWVILIMAVGLAAAPAHSGVAAEVKKKPVAAKKKPAAPKQARKSAPPRVVRAVPVKPEVIPVARKFGAALPAAAASAPGWDAPDIQASSVAIIDQRTGAILYEKNADAVVPIASITKLMTAMVVLDAEPNLDEIITINHEDLDTLKGTTSRLAIGTRLTREEMLRLALMSSENRAAAALSRYYPGGRPAFVAAMNAKARELGLYDTRFADATGLNPANVSSARDLIGLVAAAHSYPLIRELSTADEYQVTVNGRPQVFRNTNALVRSGDWQIGLSKTGYISEAGRCLVMQAWFDNRPTIIVLLDSWGKLTRIGDAHRIRRWIESAASPGGALRS